MTERTRKLASIQKVIDKKPITFTNDKWELEIAWAIEEITVQGWHLVAKKNEFQVWDLCVYFEIDSFLPADKTQFAFLLNKGTKKMIVDNQEVEGIRLKTIRLKWVISQWLALPLSAFPEIKENLIEWAHRESIESPDVWNVEEAWKKFDDLVSSNLENLEWVDVTDILRVLKYEAALPASLAWMARGNFPTFIPKTDEPRIQSNTRLLDKYKDEEFYITEKLDWSSITLYLATIENKETEQDELTFWVCSRNLDLKETDDNTYWKVARTMKIEEKLREIYEKTGIEYALQGELVGEWIQGNKLKVKWHKIYFYNVWDITNQEYLDFANFKKFITDLWFETVPVIYENHKLTFNNVDEIVEFVTIKSSINKDAWQEWFVFRTVREFDDDRVGRVSFKCISPEFLLKGGE